ncbi:MFS transporter [Pseudomonas sp. DTU12.3]|uniref:MFS transporter n=1 Tax=Pseudomonas sp. DTU12.3 TaxID=2073078 RepID=UPI00101324F3|nr:MFS transporter [Pseudomonas sp. DTU12.3]QAX85378.1 MFS transporter [Pseudomonas sp. DTU12.3]
MSFPTTDCADADVSAAAVDSAQPLNAWLAVFAVAISAIVFCTTEFLPIGLLRYISAGMNVSEGTAGLLVTAPGLLAALAAPLLAIGVGRIDRRYVLLSLAALLVVANLLSMLASSFAVLLIGRVLFGIGLGGFWAVGAGIGSRLVQEGSVARATSIIFAGVSIGMLLGGSAGALIGEMFGVTGAFALALGLSVLSFVAQALWLPKLPVERAMPARDLLGIVLTGNGRVGLLVMFLALCGQFAAYTYVTPFLAQQAHFDAASISAILFAYTLVGLGGNFIAGGLQRFNVKTLLAATIGLLFGALGMLAWWATSPMWVLLLMAVWGLAYGALPLVLQIWMAKAAPDAQEGGMALFVANFQISIALGSLGGGLLVDGLGVSQALGYCVVAGIAALLVLAVNTRKT